MRVVLLVGDDIRIIRERAVAQVAGELGKRDHLRRLRPTIGDIGVVGERVVVLRVWIGVAAKPSSRGNALCVNFPTLAALVEMANHIVLRVSAGGPIGSFYHLSGGDGEVVGDGAVRVGVVLAGVPISLR